MEKTLKTWKARRDRKQSGLCVFIDTKRLVLSNPIGSVYDLRSFTKLLTCDDKGVFTVYRKHTQGGRRLVRERVRRRWL
jgi:hypothetical protein